MNRTGWLLLVLGVIVGWIGIRAYQVGLFNACDQLRERCSQAASVSIDDSVNCAAFAFASMGRKVSNTMCMKALEVMDEGKR